MSCCWPDGREAALLRDDRRDVDLDLAAGRLLPEQAVGVRCRSRAARGSRAAPRAPSAGRAPASARSARPATSVRFIASRCDRGSRCPSRPGVAAPRSPRSVRAAPRTSVDAGAAASLSDVALDLRTDLVERAASALRRARAPRRGAARSPIARGRPSGRARSSASRRRTPRRTGRAMPLRVRALHVARQHQGVAERSCGDVVARRPRASRAALRVAFGRVAPAIRAQVHLAKRHLAARPETGRDARPARPGAPHRSPAPQSTLSSTRNSSFCRSRRRITVSSRSRPSASAFAGRRARRARSRRPGP